MSLLLNSPFLKGAIIKIVYFQFLQMLLNSPFLKGAIIKIVYFQFLKMLLNSPFLKGVAFLPFFRKAKMTGYL